VEVNLGAIEFFIARSDFGNLILVARNGRLVSLDISTDDQLHLRKSLLARYPDAKEEEKPFRALLRALDRYFKGQEVAFEMMLDMEDLGDFTRAVLAEVSKVPYGKTTSYSNVGRAIGFGRAPRAVGQALGRNPIPIIVPCHRVVKADRSLGGFGMGIDIKARLLTLEGVRLKRHGNSSVVLL
jgi:methylated-DNA-[protein]-cysteine S-methyltransferase